MNQATNPYVMLHDEKRCIGCQDMYGCLQSFE